MAACSACGRTYDLAHYASGYAFQCTCGQFLVLRGQELLPTDAASLPDSDAFVDEPDTAVARPTYTSSPKQTNLHTPVSPDEDSLAFAMGEVGDETLGADRQTHGYFFAEEIDTHTHESLSESTSITPSPYVAALQQAQSPHDLQVPQAAYTRHWGDPSHGAEPVYRHGSGGMMPTVSTSGGMMPTVPVPVQHARPKLEVFDQAVQAASVDLRDLPDYRDSEETSNEGTQAPLDLGEVVPVGTDGRAILAFFCALFFLGPLAIFSGFWSLRRIRRRAGLLNGRFLAWFSILLGVAQSAALGLLAAAWLFPSRSWPGVDLLLRVLGEPNKAKRSPYQEEEPTQSPRLDRALALRLLAHEWAFLKGQPLSRSLQHAYIYQEEGARYAFLHWHHPQKDERYRSLFVFSTQKRWYVALMGSGRPYEVRCKQSGPPRLTTETAAALIGCFWKMRGPFSHVSIHNMYVLQKGPASRAYAYWLLRKRPPQGQEQSWYVKSLFHRSQRGDWYLSRYAIRPQRGLLYAFSRAGGMVLTLDIAQDLLRAFYQEQDKAASYDALHLMKQEQEEAVMVWRRERETWLGKMRRANDEKWYLVQVKPLPRAFLEQSTKPTSALQEDDATGILQHYWRGQPSPPTIQSLQVHQEAQQPYARAYWFWTVIAKQKRRVSKEIRLFSSLFGQTQQGTWVLLDASLAGTWIVPKATEQVLPDVRFAQKDGPLMSEDTARFILRQFWKEDEHFAGIQIRDLYISQEPQSHTAIAHWSLERGGSPQGIRTSFLRSNQGVWFLGRYQLTGKGFSLEVAANEGPELSTQTAVSMLERQIKSEEPRKKRNVLSPFVYQEGKPPHAWVLWVLREGDQDQIMTSLFHRSTRGKWYLSALQSPFTPPLATSQGLPL